MHRFFQPARLFSVRVSKSLRSSQVELDPVPKWNYDPNLLRGRQKHEPEYAHLVTQAVQSGESGGRVSMSDCITTPIAQTSAYTFRNTAQLIAFCENKYVSHEYGRYGNPTTKVCEDKILALEKGEDCLLSNSGLCSLTTMMMALAKKGDLIMTTIDTSDRTAKFIRNFLPKLGIQSKFVSANEIEENILSEKPALFFASSPTYPFLNCVDISKIADACKHTGTIFAIDNSFATPVNQLPLQLGADIVIHRASKCLSGHNDVLAGAIVGKQEVVERIRGLHAVLGGVLDPHASYLLLRGIKTLGARVEHQNRSAMQLATYLSSMPQVEKVYYPGMSSHPDHHLASRQMSGFGSTFSFVMRGGYEDNNTEKNENINHEEISYQRARTFIDALRIPYIAASCFGGIESTVEMPAIRLEGEESESTSKIPRGLIQYSVGIEDTVDLLADVAQGLKKSSMWLLH